MGWWKERLPFLLIYICVGDPLDWEQKSGWSWSTGATAVHGAGVWGWGTQVLWEK